MRIFHHADHFGMERDCFTPARINSAGFDVSAQGVAYAEARRTISYEIKWSGRPNVAEPPSFLSPLSSQAGILGLEWKRLP